MKWIVETLNTTVDAEIAELPGDMRAKLARIVDMIAELGPEQVGAPHLKHIRGKLWEIRVSGRSGISRALYLTVAGRRVILLRAFIKKTQQTPEDEIELAFKRARTLQ